MIPRDVLAEWIMWDRETEAQLTRHIKFFSKLKLKRIYQAGRIHVLLSEIINWLKGERDELRRKNIEHKENKRAVIRY